jgi:hypothetical protein
MSDALSAILETTTAEPLATGVQHSSATRRSARPPTLTGTSSRSAMRPRSRIWIDMSLRGVERGTRSDLTVALSRETRANCASALLGAGRGSSAEAPC